MCSSDFGTTRTRFVRLAIIYIERKDCSSADALNSGMSGMSHACMRFPEEITSQLAMLFISNTFYSGKEKFLTQKRRAKFRIPCLSRALLCMVGYRCAV